MAKIGDFAIAKFDDEEVPCLITGRPWSAPNEQKFIYWRRTKSGKMILDENHLPKGRLKGTGLNLTYIQNATLV